MVVTLAFFVHAVEPFFHRPLLSSRLRVNEAVLLHHVEGQRHSFARLCLLCLQRFELFLDLVDLGCHFFVDFLVELRVHHFEFDFEL